MLPAGAAWWMARSANAAMMALHLSGVQFLKPWQPPELEPWEGPFADPHQRLPQEPTVAAERRATMRAWRQRQRDRKGGGGSVPAIRSTIRGARPDDAVGKSAKQVRATIAIPYAAATSCENTRKEITKILRRLVVRKSARRA
jgi:hypothetical protein